MMWFDWNTMSVLGWTMMVVLWGAVISLVVGGFRTLATTQDGTPDAVEVLRRRYAAGEIDRGEYEERGRTLANATSQTR